MVWIKANTVIFFWVWVIEPVLCSLQVLNAWPEVVA